MIKEIIKTILILCGILLVSFLVLLFAIFSALDGFDSDNVNYSVTDLKENFEARKYEIYEVKKYLNKIIPSNKSIQIEFEDDSTLGIFHVKVDDEFQNNWNVQINSVKVDSLLNNLGWTNENLKILKDKLDSANCIGISSGEPCVISFQRSGMGIYSFLVFDEPIPDNLKPNYNDSCTFIMVNNKLVLEYGGGVMGNQCFYNLK